MAEADGADCGREPVLGVPAGRFQKGHRLQNRCCCCRCYTTTVLGRALITANLAIGFFIAYLGNTVSLPYLL
jgi:hypothetical protein